MFYKNLPVSGFELRTIGIGSDHSANWATTTAKLFYLLPDWGSGCGYVDRSLTSVVRGLWFDYTNRQTYIIFILSILLKRRNKVNRGQERRNF